MRGESFKIGTPVHLLVAESECAPGWIVAWHDPQQHASVLALSDPTEGRFSELFPHSDTAPDDESCSQIGSFHLPGRCKWGR